MAVRRNALPRAERRISLHRGKEADKPAKNTRRVVKPEKVKGRWREKIGSTLSITFLGIVWVLIFAGVSLSILFGYRYLTTANYFSLKYVEIQGNSRLVSREILENVQLEDGANILALSINEIEQKLVRHPWVKEVSVKRILPDRLVIGVQEREPAFVMLLQNGMYYADDRGSIIAPVTSAKFTPLPMLEVEKGAEGMTGHLPDVLQYFREAGMPLEGKKVSFVRLSASRGVEFFIEDSRLKISVGLEEWMPNLDRLNIVLEDLQRRKELQAVREIKAHGTSVWVEKAVRSGNG